MSEQLLYRDEQRGGLLHIADQGQRGWLTDRQGGRVYGAAESRRQV